MALESFLGVFKFLRKCLAIIPFILVGSLSNAQTYAIDWTVNGLSYEGNQYTELRLDLEALSRFFGANGILSTGLFFRPIDGTCLVEITNTVVCELRLDALTLSLRMDPDTLNGTADLIDTQTAIELSSGLITLDSFD